MASIRINRHGHLGIDFRYRGKRQFLSTGLADTKQNRRHAVHKKNAIEHDISANNLNISKYFAQVVPGSKTSIALAKYFDHFVSELNMRRSSWDGLNAMWRNHISPELGHCRLVDIDRHKILVFRKSLVDKGLASSFVNDIIRRLGQILRLAHDEEVIPKDPTKKIGQLPTVVVTPPDPFSLDELNHFLNFLKEKKPEYYNLIFVWSRCGFRAGEIMALKWDEIDYFNSSISVNSTIIRHGEEGPPKTKQSRRTIRPHQSVFSALKDQEKYSRMASPYVFVDPHTNSRFSDNWALNARFKRLMALSGIKYRPPNQLRHTFATLHIASGENISWVSQMLGHSNVNMTLSHYNRYIPNTTRSDGSAFDKMTSRGLLKKHGEPGCHIEVKTGQVEVNA